MWAQRRRRCGQRSLRGPPRPLRTRRLRCVRTPPCRHGEGREQRRGRRRWNRCHACPNPFARRKPAPAVRSPGAQPRRAPERLRRAPGPVRSSPSPEPPSESVSAKGRDPQGADGAPPRPRRPRRDGRAGEAAATPAHAAARRGAPTMSDTPPAFSARPVRGCRLPSIARAAHGRGNCQGEIRHDTSSHAIAHHRTRAGAARCSASSLDPLESEPIDALLRRSASSTRAEQQARTTDGVERPIHPIRESFFYGGRFAESYAVDPCGGSAARPGHRIRRGRGRPGGRAGGGADADRDDADQQRRTIKF